MKRFKWAVASIVAIVAASVIQVQTQTVPVVPGAFGYGMTTRAAYGCGVNPVILRVTTLADAGNPYNATDAPPGSLRAALMNTAPRVIIFEVSGYITMTTWVSLLSPCVTIAGQTAPSPGITIRGVPEDFTDDHGWYIGAHDVLIQHLRFRSGANCGSNLVTWDDGYNIVFDHISTSWSQDENVHASYTALNGGLANFTLWRSIVAEGLSQVPGSGDCPGQIKEYPGQSHGVSIGSYARNVSLLQSLMAHNLERNPAGNEGHQAYVANNVMYNTHEALTFGGPAPALMSFIGNYLKRGSTGSADYAVIAGQNASGAALYYNSNTIDNGGLTPAITEFQLNSGLDPRVGYAPVTPPAGYTPSSAADAYTGVLLNAGARPTDRDAVDQRIIAMVQNRTGVVIQHPNAVGGYPALAENSRALTTPANPHVNAGAGYTNLEVWLHGYASGGTDPPPVLTDIENATGTVIVQANMSGVAGTVIPPYTGEIGATFTPLGTGQLVLSNDQRMRSNISDDYAAVFASGVPLSAQYDIDFDWTIQSLIPGNFYSVTGRSDVTASNGITVTFDAGAATCTMTTTIATVVQVIDGPRACALEVGETYHGKFLIRDTARGFEIDQVPVLYVLNSDLPDKGLTGLVVYATTADTDYTGTHLRNYLVRDVTSVLTPSTLPRRYRILGQLWDRAF